MFRPFVIVLAIAILCGCIVLAIPVLRGWTDIPQEPKPQCREALEKYVQKIGQQDFDSSYDLLLAAIRLDPSSAEVFDATIDFIDKARASEDGQALDLADDMFSRADGLVPFQAVSRIEKARKELKELSKRAEAAKMPPSKPAAATDSEALEAIDHDLQELSGAQLAPEARSIVLQAIRRDLEAVAAQSLSSGLYSKPRFWASWRKLKESLEKEESQTLTALYETSAKLVSGFEKDVQDVLKKYEQAKVTGLPEVSDKMLEIVQRGYRLRTALVPFAEGGIDAAKNDQETLDKKIETLERTREWIHNQHVLAQIKYVRATSDLGTMEKLKRLAAYDERRLAPYVLQRFQEEWNYWFEQLSSEEEKVEATRARLLREVSK